MRHQDYIEIRIDCLEMVHAQLHRLTGHSKKYNWRKIILENKTRESGNYIRGNKIAEIAYSRFLKSYCQSVMIEIRGFLMKDFILVRLERNAVS